jgi:hypothetical protein
MATNRLILDGLDAFRADLRRLPQALAQEGARIVGAAADRAAAALVAAYPARTGNLRHGVRATHRQTAHGAESVVQSRSRHAHLYAYGTQLRRTARGWSRGAMPPAPPRAQLGRIARRERTAMVTALTALLRRQGLEVRGDL